MYTEELVRSTVAYGALVRAGVFAFNLRGNYQRRGDDWSIQFTMLGVMDREYGKEAARQYLIDAYSASGIYFYQRSSDKDNHFRATFHRGDM